MKKTLLVLFNSIIMFSGCKKKITKNIAPEKPKFEQPIIQDLTTKNQNKKDSIKALFINNKNDQHSPIKIVSSKLLPNQYSNHKDIKIIYKNVTKKDIKAIKLEWYCENSFNEPAHGKFFYIQGKSTENVTELLRAGSSQFQIWEDFSTDANKIIKARAFYVMFTDNTTWELAQ